MKQITEDYVSYEIAKLLKEKGFDVPIISTWIDHSKLVSCPAAISIFPEEKNWNSITGGLEDIYFSAPTLQMTMKWLREVHSIYITSEPDINDKHCFYPVIYTMTEESWDIQCFEELEKLSFDKPEQAVEAALLYVLKNLI